MHILHAFCETYFRGIFVSMLLTHEGPSWVGFIMGDSSWVMDHHGSWTIMGWCQLATPDSLYTTSVETLLDA